MKYLLCVALLCLFSCTQPKEINELNSSIKDLRDSVDNLNCVMMISREDPYVLHMRVCEYYALPRNCKLTTKDVIEYIDRVCSQERQ